MPTYEFACPSGHEFERFFRKISDSTSEIPCQQCALTATRQISGGGGLVFKGSGFYLTDYGRNAHKKAAPESGNGTAKADSGGSESGGTKAPESGATSASPKPAESKPASATKTPSDG